MNVAIHSIIGSSCGLAIWVLIIAYFCTHRRPRPTKETNIIHIVSEATSAHFEAEKYLREAFAKAKGNECHTFQETDMQSTFHMEGRWARPMTDSWEEVNGEKFIEDMSESQKTTPVRIIELENVEPSEELSVEGMANNMFTSSFREHLVPEQIYCLDNQDSLSSQHSENTTLKKQNGKHVIAEELSTTRNSAVSECRLSKGEGKPMVVKETKENYRIISLTEVDAEKIDIFESASVVDTLNL